MDDHEKYIKRCLELAKNGLGNTYPNPLVGSVIVNNGKIIGEGWHQKSGGNHAEVNAILAVKNKKLLKEATLYVNLEPCSHFGKTPPCTNLIIENQIPNVVIGSLDTNPVVSGKGIKKLQEANRNVKVGVLAEQCFEVNKRFFTFHQQKRPYIILKWAQSIDNFIAPKKKLESKPVWITNKYSRQLVHKWRSEEEAVLVGTKTVLDDNPSLTTRDWYGNNPVRIVLDKMNCISKQNHIFDNDAKTVVLSENEIDFNSVTTAEEVVSFLYKQNIQSVIVEGGTKTINSFIDSNLWDEARVFMGTAAFFEGTIAPIINKKTKFETTILEDKLLIFYNND